MTMWKKLCIKRNEDRVMNFWYFLWEWFDQEVLWTVTRSLTVSQKQLRMGRIVSWKCSWILWSLSVCTDLILWSLGVCTDLILWSLGVCTDLILWSLGVCTDLIYNSGIKLSSAVDRKCKTNLRSFSCILSDSNWLTSR